MGDQASSNRSEPWPLLGAVPGQTSRDGEDLGDHGRVFDGGDDPEDAPGFAGVVCFNNFYSLINNTFTALTTTLT